MSKIDDKTDEEIGATFRELAKELRVSLDVLYNGAQSTFENAKLQNPISWFTPHKVINEQEITAEMLYDFPEWTKRSDGVERKT